MATGLLIPFRRDNKADFAYGSAAELAQAKIIQIAGTRPSEMPWSDLGAALDDLRHMDSPVSRQLARVRLTDALARWAPDIRVLDLQIESRRPAGSLTKNALHIALGYDVVAQDGSTILADQRLELEV